MAYATIEDLRRVLKDEFFDYPASIDDELERAKSKIDSHLASRYSLPFDNTSLYATVPVQIKWIASYLVAYYLWDSVTVLEGQVDDTAAQRWLSMANTWLDRIAEGKDRLTLDDGTLVTDLSAAAGKPRGLDRTAEDEPYWFTREQAHNW